MEAAEVRGGRVLVVDDDPDVREAVETALELEGHRVMTATDGLAALQQLGQAEFDAVVLDVLMPNLDGFEVCRRLLELFLRQPRQGLTRELIMERVWNSAFGPTSNPLEVYISYLRRKTEAGGEPRLIHTVRGVGYSLREP